MKYYNKFVEIRQNEDLIYANFLKWVVLNNA